MTNPAHDESGAHTGEPSAPGAAAAAVDAVAPDQGGSQAAPESSGRGARFAVLGGHLLALALVVGLGLLAYHEITGFQLVGYDTFLQINASRIESFPDLVGTFTEKLTDGRIVGKFYRPLQNLSIALDYWLWKLEPFGYHLSSLIVFCGCVVLAYVATRRLLGPGAWIAAIVAAAYFALHPILQNVVPVPCRRSETLTVLFLLLTLVALSQKRPGAGFAALLAGVCVALASGAKEHGVLGLGLVFLHQWLFADKRAFWARCKAATLAAVPAFTFVLAYLINRTIVVRGLGGYEREVHGGYFEKAGKFLPRLMEELLAPWTFVPGISATTLAIAAGSLLVLFSVVFLVMGVASSDEARRRVARLLILGWAWILPPLALVGLGAEYYPWYGVIPLAGLALVLGAIVHGAVRSVQRSGATRIVGGLAAVAAAWFVLCPLFVSPLIRDYDEWREASQILEEELVELEQKLSEAKLGKRIVISLVPEYYGPEHADRPTLSGVSLLSFRGVRAWVEMTQSGRKMRVVQLHKTEGWRAGRDEILLQVRHLD